MDWDESGDEDAGQIDAGDLKNIHMRLNNLSPELTNKALRICLDASNRHKMDKDMASDVKGQVEKDEAFNEGPGGWQVIIGRSFGASITHETSLIFFFDITSNKRSVMMFRTQ
jgi:hypothetical protein